MFSHANKIDIVEKNMNQKTEYITQQSNDLLNESSINSEINSSNKKLNRHVYDMDNLLELVPIGRSSIYHEES